MALLPYLRFTGGLTAATAAVLSALPVGCARHALPADPLVGSWQGTMATGNTAAVSTWEFRRDGTQSLTLTLPQGSMTTAGTWTARKGILTERATDRVVVLGDEPKVVMLTNPMETVFSYQVQGDTLRLTRIDTHQQTELTREKEGQENPIR